MMRRALLVLCYLFVCINANAEVNIPEIYKDKAGNSIRLKKVDSSAGVDLYADKDKDISIQIVDLKAGASLEPYLVKIEKNDLSEVTKKYTGVSSYYSNASSEQKKFGHLTAEDIYKKKSRLFSVFNTSDFEDYKSNSDECHISISNPLCDDYKSNSDECHISISNPFCDDYTELAFDSYINNRVYLGANKLDFEKSGMILLIDSGSVDIREFSQDDIKDTLAFFLVKNSLHSNNHAITGKYLDLNPVKWKDENEEADAKTAVGIIDHYTFIIVVAKKLTVVELATIFKNFNVIGANVASGKCTIAEKIDELCTKMKAMWLDSGSSSQLYNENFQIDSDENRPIPAAMLVYGSDITNHCGDFNKVPFRKNNNDIEIHKWGGSNIYIQNCKGRTSDIESAVFEYERDYYFVDSDFWAKYVNSKGESSLGNPIMDKVSIPGGNCQSFEKGMLSLFFNIPYKVKVDFNTQQTCAEFMTTDDCFADVNYLTSYREDICQVKKDGIFNGYPNARFIPNSKVERQDALKVILKLKYSDDDFKSFSSEKPKFSDIKSNMWINKYANLALSKNIIQEKNKFLPKGILNLAEVSKLIIKTLDITVLKKTAEEHWSAPYIEKLKLMGVKNTDDYAYGDSINRGYLAHIIATVKNGGK